MNERLNVGFVGCGNFVKNFIPLFQAHPYVASVAVTDLIPARRLKTAKLWPYLISAILRPV